MTHRVLRIRLSALVAVVIVAASLLAGCGQGASQESQSSPAHVARVFVEKFGWHPEGAPTVSRNTVPVIEPASHNDVSNELLKDAGLPSLVQLAGQEVETYNFHLTDQREGNLKGLPLHAMVWVREGQVVGAWILAQGGPGDAVYVGAGYSIQGRTLEEVTGQDFQVWRQSRLAAANQGPNAGEADNPPASPVTWTIRSLDEPWIQAPMAIRVALPQNFRLTFSAAVDRASVERVLRDGLVQNYDVRSEWANDRALDFTILSGPVTEHGFFRRLSPAGAVDASGAALTAATASGTRGPAEMLLSFGPRSTVWRWTPGDGARQAATLPGAFDVLSVSGDGNRLALRLYGLPAAGGWPPVGPPPGFAYWYDMQSGKLERLVDMGGWLVPQWLADGSLIISASDMADLDGDRGKIGVNLMRVAPDGTQTVLVRNRSVVDYVVSPDGKRLAVFLSRQEQGAPGDIWLINLATGQRQEWPGAYTPALTPNGVPEVTALWSPDGKTIVLSDTTGLVQEDTWPCRLLALDPATGRTRVLLKESRLPQSWSPDSKYLFVGAVGVLSMPDATVALDAKLDWSGAFSPRGDRIYIPGTGEGDSLFSVPDWRPLGQTPSGEGRPDWSPDGRFLAFGQGEGGWAIVTADGESVWSRQSTGESATAHPLWSPDGRFLAVPGVGVGDTVTGKFQTLPKDLGVPVGWTADDTLYLGLGRHEFDDDYVKPTQFPR